MIRSTEDILVKLGIESLNDMQQEACKRIASENEVILLSPTGTGKTLAFLLPVLELLKPQKEGIQALILVPSRELAIQIETVLRDAGSGYKVNAVYGGRAGSKDKIELYQAPAILIGTPGRIADHIRRENVDVSGIEILILDEFDKSLEIGFEKEMREIWEALPNVNRKILTSATQQIQIPDFAGLQNPVTLDFTAEKTERLSLKVIAVKHDQKLQSLVLLLSQLGHTRGIIFCNFKESIQVVSSFLEERGISHSLFYGGLEQTDRERALIKFRNGTNAYLLATDLAARGIDVPEIDFIIHYETPSKEEEFIHRNGRTARMQTEGSAYVLKTEKQRLPGFIRDYEELALNSIFLPIAESPWETLFISGGRQDKISKGDIAGLFFKQGGLEKEDLGNIELKQDCAFVAVKKEKSQKLIGQLNNSRLKNKKVRISLLQ